MYILNNMALFIIHIIDIKYDSRADTPSGRGQPESSISEDPCI